LVIKHDIVLSYVSLILFNSFLVLDISFVLHYEKLPRVKFEHSSLDEFSLVLLPRTPSYSYHL
jgi:hypothetical protein